MLGIYFHLPLLTPLLTHLSPTSRYPPQTCSSSPCNVAKQIKSGPAVPIFRLNSPLSPYEALHNFKSGSYDLPSSPLFTTESGHVASRFWFHHHLRLILAKSGIDLSLYSAHSFRIGAASSASSLGVVDHTIQLLGRWSSQV